MRAIELLRNEHTLIGRVVSCLGRAADAVREGGPVDEDLFRKALEFLAGFARRFHQAREEILLRLMAERGFVNAGMNEQSDILDFAGAVLRALPDAARGDATARRLLAENAKAYVGLTRSHVVEMALVLDAAEGYLSEQDDRTLLSLFRAAARAVTHDSGETAAERYERLAEEVGQRQE